MSTIQITAFDALFNASNKEINAARLGKVKKANQKLIDNAIDAADALIDDAEDKINLSTEAVAKGGKINPQVIIDQYAIIEKAEQAIKSLTAFKKEFFKEVKIEGKGRQRVVTEVTATEEEK